MNLINRFKKETSSFSDLILFKEDPDVLEDDIRNLLKNGTYKPTYTPLVKPFLDKESRHFLGFLSDSDSIGLSITYFGDLCNNNMKPVPQKISDFLKDQGIFDPEQQHIFRKNINYECFGAGFIHAYETQTGKKNIYLYGMVENPFYSIYTFAHELTHALQDKNDFGPYDLHRGEKQKGTMDHLSDYREIHANLTAGTFMMIKALQTQNPEVIKKTENLLLDYAATMSSSVKRGNLGIRYFDWRGVKHVLQDLPQKYQTMLTKTGMIDWNKMYSYTTNVMKEMDYTPQKIDEFEQLLQPQWKDQPINTSLLAEIKPHVGKNSIFDDFYEAMNHMIKHPKTPYERLRNFYQMLANPVCRKERLFAKWTDSFPHIQEYRDLFRYSSLDKSKTL